MSCYNCGNPTVYRQEGSVQGCYCEKCNCWGVVTTYIDPIYKDETTYSVNIEGADFKNLRLIKDISLAIGKNYLEVRKMLQKDNILIYEGQASHVLYIANILKDNVVKYRITPEFNY